MSHPNFSSVTSSFVTPEHDYQAHSGMTATHGPTQIIYKRGGATGQTVATETITYDNNDYVVTRSISWNL
jgi:hypothetical protein